MREKRDSLRRRALLLAAILVGAVALLAWMARKRPSLPPGPVESSLAGGPPPAAETARARKAPPPLPPPARLPPPEPAPVVDAVVLEKAEVCAGEENLVTVHAHTLNGTDDFLHYVIDGNMGDSVPLRLWLDKDGRVEGTHVIRVFGRTNTAVTVPLPEYRVHDCPPSRIASVEQHLRANSWAEFEFIARVVTLPPATGAARAVRPFTPTSYEWSFGDGESATTSAPAASHSYEGRAQDALYSYFIVGVRVRSLEGDTLSARTTLPLINAAFESFARKGIVQLLIALDPRFPRVDDQGRVVQHVRLWHSRPDSVRIDAATETKYFETGAGQSRPRAIDPAALLGSTSIPPGKDGVGTAVVLDTTADPGVFSVTYRIAGTSVDGHPVMGAFSVMRPPAVPTAENSQRVTDPELRAKILAARAILGRDVVDDEDIWRLEREGRLVLTGR